METPVLLLAYNRPKLVSKVLKRLHQVGASKVYVSVDGPKNKADKHLTDAIEFELEKWKNIIVSTRFSANNLGCKNAVIQGINWFFKNEKEGIILEDDCLPSEHFFPFAGVLLDRYRNNPKVGMISGNNPLGNWDGDNGFFLSRIGHIWGWATWKNKWESFNPELPDFDEFVNNKGFQRAFGPTPLAKNREELTLQSIIGEIDTWDYQWMAHLLMSSQFAIVPRNNLVQNLGFENDGTHLTEKPNWINNSIATSPLDIASSEPEVDGEYETELRLNSKENSTSWRNSFYFKTAGSKAEQKPRVLFINSTDIGGGAERVAFSLFESFLELGFDCKLLVETKKSSHNLVEEIKNFTAQVVQFNPEVIHVHNLHGTSVDLKTLTEISNTIPVLFTLHDTWLVSGSTEHPFQPENEDLFILEAKTWKTILKQRKKFIEMSNIRFTAPSHWMQQLFYSTHRKRAYFVPNSIKKSRKSDFSIESNRYILFVANNPEKNPYKDYETLVKAWLKANKNLDVRGCDLVIIGGDKFELTESEFKLIGLGKLSSDDVLSAMENALLTIQASKQDNSPLTILESHSVGTKVLASLVGGIPELLDNQEQSWMYQSKNIDDLAEKLVVALSSTKAKAVKSHPDFQSVVATYLGHYIDLTNV